jgi:hypothetical protein
MREPKKGSDKMKLISELWIRWAMLSFCIYKFILFLNSLFSYQPGGDVQIIHIVHGLAALAIGHAVIDLLTILKDIASKLGM